MNHLVGAAANGTLRAILTPQAGKRQLISLRGPDSFKFLQSMSTKKTMDLIAAEESGEFCDFAAFLNPKGRVLSEALIMFRSRSKSWLIDVPSPSVQPLLEHFKQYKMRNNILIDTDEANSAYKIWTLVATSEQNLKELSLWLLNQTSQMDVIFHQDPRFPLSLRLLVPSHLNPMTQMPPLGDIYEETTSDNQSLYQYFRNMNGIPEGAPQINSSASIPFECNFDLMNGIDYDKGCYLGQELVARTHYRGAVRKRLFPLISLGTPKTLTSNAKVASSELYSTLLSHDLATSEHTLIPGTMLRKISDITTSTTSSGNSSRPKVTRVDVELDPIYGVTNPFPTEGGPILPIRNDLELEAVLSGKGLGSPLGAASASRVSKLSGGHSWNAGMGMMRTDDWHASPSLLFYAPGSGDQTQGTILKGVKPWWYGSYLHWREEAESKALAIAAEEL